MPRSVNRLTFWAITLVTGAVGFVWGVDGDRVEQIQRPAVALLAGATLAAAVALRVGRGSAERLEGDLAE